MREHSVILDFAEKASPAPAGGPGGLVEPVVVGVRFVPHDQPLPLNSHSMVYEAAHVAKTGDGTLYGFTVYNSKASDQFVQLFDASALPADGAVPDAVFRVGATSTLGVYYGEVGRACWQGIVVCNSSTGPTKTIGSADCWFDVQFV